jgi:hypothetical protein
VTDLRSRPAGLDGRMVAVDPCSDPRWASLARGPRGSLFASPPWIAALVDTYGFAVTAEMVLDGDGTPVAGLARAEVDDLRGRRVVSLPFCDRVDPVADAPQWDRLVGPLLDRGVPVELRVLDAAPPRRDPRFAVTGELAWHATDLERPEQDLLAGLHPGVRQHIRKARRSGVTVSIGDGLDDVRAFHQLHRGTRKRKYRLLAQPVAFFERLWERFASSGDLAVALASHEGDVIAGILCLRWDDVVYYKFAASDGERLAVRPNELLAWECLRLGQAWGCRSFDWGVSDLDQPGLVHYKRKYATEERRVAVLRHLPPGHVGNDHGTGALLRDLTELLTRDEVPDAVTQRAGELLYRYFC